MRNPLRALDWAILGFYDRLNRRFVKEVGCKTTTLLRILIGLAVGSLLIWAVLGERSEMIQQAIIAGLFGFIMNHQVTKAEEYQVGPDSILEASKSFWGVRIFILGIYVLFGYRSAPLFVIIEWKYKILMLATPVLMGSMLYFIALLPTRRAVIIERESRAVQPSDT